MSEGASREPGGKQQNDNNNTRCDHGRERMRKSRAVVERFQRCERTGDREARPAAARSRSVCARLRVQWRCHAPAGAGSSWPPGRWPRPGCQKPAGTGARSRRGAPGSGQGYLRTGGDGKGEGGRSDRGQGSWPEAAPPEGQGGRGRFAGCGRGGRSRAADVLSGRRGFSTRNPRLGLRQSSADPGRSPRVSPQHVAVPGFQARTGKEHAAHALVRDVELGQLALRTRGDGGAQSRLGVGRGARAVPSLRA